MLCEIGAFFSLLGSALVAIGGILHLNSRKQTAAHSPPETPGAFNALGAETPVAAPVTFSPPAQTRPTACQC